MRDIEERRGGCGRGIVGKHFDEAVLLNHVHAVGAVGGSGQEDGRGEAKMRIGIDKDLRKSQRCHEGEREENPKSASPALQSGIIPSYTVVSSTGSRTERFR